jgi:transmembrane sensor
MESTAQIEHRAAAWLAKRDGDDWTAGDEAALQSWLGASTANRIAYLRVEAAWEETPRLKALAAGLPNDAGSKSEWRLPVSFEEASPAPASQMPELMTKKKAWLFAVAATVMIAIGIAAYLGSARFHGDLYTTPVGGMASVPLEDGSKITLNTDSTIRVALSTYERQIYLTQGEAFFDVARDPVRPFIVSAGRQRVVAVGTRFSVRRGEDGLRVVVTEGKVRIEDSKDGGSVLLVAAGGVAKTGKYGGLIQKKTPPEAEEILSWRTGYLTFNDTPLADAVAEFNQYNTQRIIVDDPEAARIPLTGKFKPSNYEAFVRLLEDGYAIRVERVGEKIILTAQ